MLQLRNKLSRGGWVAGWVAGWLEKAKIKPTQPSWSLSLAELGKNELTNGILQPKFFVQKCF